MWRIVNQKTIAINFQNLLTRKMFKKAQTKHLPDSPTAFELFQHLKLNAMRSHRVYMYVFTYLRLKFFFNWNWNWIGVVVESRKFRGNMKSIHKIDMFASFVPNTANVDVLLYWCFHLIVNFWTWLLYLYSELFSYRRVGVIRKQRAKHWICWM